MGGERVQGQEASPLRADILKVDVVLLLAVENLHRPLLAHPVAHLARVDPDGQVGGEVLYDVGDGVAALPGSPVEDGVRGVRDLETSVGRAFEWFVWIPVTLELVTQGTVQFLTEQVDPPEWREV